MSKMINSGCNWWWWWYISRSRERLANKQLWSIALGNHRSSGWTFIQLSSLKIPTWIVFMAFSLFVSTAVHLWYTSINAPIGTLVSRIYSATGQRHRATFCNVLRLGHRFKPQDGHGYSICCAFNLHRPLTIRVRSPYCQMPDSVVEPGTSKTIIRHLE
jgi:hypothetical protein